MRRILVFALSGLLIPVFSAAQAPHRMAIRAGRLIDGKSEKPVENAFILIEGDKIVSVTPGGSAPAGAKVIDLSKATVLPGFIDTHTHLLLHGFRTKLRCKERGRAIRSFPPSTRRSPWTR